MEYTAQARAADRARIPSLDTKITELEEVLGALRLERDAAQDRLDTYIYPILTIPDEILSEIFLQCIPPYPECPPLFGVYSPSKLGQICGHWKRVAHATPQLWRAICCTSVWPNYPDGQLLSTLETWLRRSRALPLALVFAFDAVAEEDETAVLLDIIVNNRARWEHLAVDLGEGKPKLRRLLEGTAPFLRELEVRIGDYGAHAQGCSRPLDAPKLKTAVLHAYGVPDAGVVTWLPWAQLTRLSLADIPLAMMATILQQSNQLVHCRLVLNEDGANVSIHRSPILLPHLTTLLVQMVDSSSEAEQLSLSLFKLIRAPALLRFYLDEDILEPEQDRPGLLVIDVVAGFGCSKLEELRVAYSQATPSTFTEALPNLVDVRVYPDTGMGSLDCCRSDGWEWPAWDLMHRYSRGASAGND
ncbi:WD40 repeat-like protein [Mycena kentingensis (nom. inval.)]|nr:WD40 repeat-like protein [Mycena kentingensis (nom. inval.)]